MFLTQADLDWFTKHMNNSNTSLLQRVKQDAKRCCEKSSQTRSTRGESDEASGVFVLLTRNDRLQIVLLYWTMS